MADYYVYSGAGGSGNGSSWANAFTTMAAAITGGASSDTFFMAHDHDESTASALTLAFKGTNGLPNRVIVVNRAGSVPPVAADVVTTPSAKIKTTGGSGIALTGGVEIWGVEFLPGFGGSGTAGFTPNNDTLWKSFKNCKFTLNAGPSSTISRGSANTGGIQMRDCTFQFGHVLQSFAMANPASDWFWKNSAGITAFAGSVPTTLISTNGFAGVWEGLDLSPINTTIVGSNSRFGRLRLVNCRLHASVVISAAQGHPQNIIEVIGCNSGSQIQRNERHGYLGVMTTETTIVRTGGATDGTTPYSWKMVIAASTRRQLALQSFEGIIWNDAVGSSKTLTVHVLTDNVTLKDDECWLEADYMDSSSYPTTSLASDEAATLLTAGANQDSDSGTAWTTTGLTTPNKQKLEVTFTPQNKGWVRWRVFCAKSSTTVYVCPEAELT